jgi:hypothetical protein
VRSGASPPQDERGPSIAAKPFVDKAYIRQMVEWQLETKMNVWEKSRQIMASADARECAYEPETVKVLTDVLIRHSKHM